MHEHTPEEHKKKHGKDVQELWEDIEKREKHISDEECDISDKEEDKDEDKEEDKEEE